jgi:hypothetical protein
MITLIRKIIFVLFWVAAFGFPIAFFFARPGAWITGELAYFYTPAVILFGEPAARMIFCGIWFVLVLLFFWRVVLSKRPVDLTPVEGMAD